MQPSAQYDAHVKTFLLWCKVNHIALVDWAQEMCGKSLPPNMPVEIVDWYFLAYEKLQGDYEDSLEF